MESKSLLPQTRNRLSGNPLRLRLSRQNGASQKNPQKFISYMRKLASSYDDLRHVTSEQASRVQNAIGNLQPVLDQMGNTDEVLREAADSVVADLSRLSARIDAENARRKVPLASEIFDVHICSWNLGNEPPLPKQVVHWVQTNHKVKADVLAFGFQECEFSLGRSRRKYARAARKRYRRWNCALDSEKSTMHTSVARGVQDDVQKSGRSKAQSTSNIKVSSNEQFHQVNDDNGGQHVDGDESTTVEPNVASADHLNGVMKVEMNVTQSDSNMLDEYEIHVEGSEQNNSSTNVVEEGSLPRKQVSSGQRNSNELEDELDEVSDEEDIDEYGSQDLLMLVPKKLPKTALHTGECSISSFSALYVADLIHKHIGLEDYYMALGAELGQMKQFVFVKRDLAFRVSNQSIATEATGFGNVATNKGGVGASMSLNGVKLAFISCHLAAHQHQVKLRNENCREIFKSFHRKLGDKNLSLTTWSDHVFCFGDLNYRLDAARLQESLTDNPELASRVRKLTAQYEVQADEVYRIDSDVLDAPKEDGPNRVVPSFNVSKRDAHVDAWSLVDQLLKKGEYKQLMMVDQLRHEQLQGRVLQMFHEELPSFHPTFKVKRAPGFDYTHLRLPSYCDRILWHNAVHREKYLKCLGFYTRPIISSSDHKPVIAEFSVECTAMHVKPPPLVKYESKQFDAKLKQRKSEKHNNGIQIDFQNVSVEIKSGPNSDGLADPRLVVCSRTLWGTSSDRRHKSESGNPQRGFLRTDSKRNRLDATWNSKELPVINCAATFQNPQELRNRGLIFCLWNRHTTQAADDILGEASLLLDQAVDLYCQHAQESSIPLTMARGKPFHFELPLVLHGVRTGTIQGSFILEGPQFQLDRTLPAITSRGKSGGGCCTVQ